MTRHATVLLLVQLATAGTVARAQSSAALAAVDQVMQEAISTRVMTGATVGVAHRGKVLFIRGYGLADLEQRVPVTDSTVYRIGSTTKQFTSAAILRLVDQGKASLADPLSKYFPDFPRASEVTLEQLLNHTSGISSYTNPAIKGNSALLTRREWSADSLIAHVARLQPTYEFDPGTSWSYSNSAYILLGAIIEKVSGKPYATFLKDELLDPLGLTNTAVDAFATVVPNRARGYDPSKGAPSGFINTDFLSLSLARSAGAMRSNAADLLAWSIALFGGKVLKPESLARMTAPARLKDGRLSSANRAPPHWLPANTEYGLGMFLGQVDGHASIGHGGAINGFNAWAETFPKEEIAIVILANTSYPAAEKTGPKVAQAVFKALLVP